MTRSKDFLRSIGFVLLDFDGPVCAAFSGYPADRIAQEMLSVAQEDGFQAPPELAQETDPMVVLSRVHSLDPALHPTLETVLSTAEIASVAHAPITPGISAFLAACHETHRPVAIVSNNSAEAINRFLDLHQELATHIHSVHGRPAENPGWMKPHPYLLRAALRSVGTTPDRALMVGDSVSDIKAAHQASMWAVGYANRPQKEPRLRSAGSDLVTEDMHELAQMLARSPGMDMPRALLTSVSQGSRKQGPGKESAL